MTRANPLKTSFNAGEFSPRMTARTDFTAKFPAGVDAMVNMIPLIEGGAMRRPGTKFVAEAFAGDKPVRLLRFEFSTEQAYILEFGDRYLRVFMNGGLVGTGATPFVAVNVVTPYTDQQLKYISVTQSADVLYITHPDVPPYKLERTSHTAWAFSKIDFQDGPWNEANLTQVTVASSGTTGTVTLTAGPTKTITNVAQSPEGLMRVTSAAHGFASGSRVRVYGVVGVAAANATWKIEKVNANTFDLRGGTFPAGQTYTSGGSIQGAPFTMTTDVGRYFRIKHSSKWGWGTITAVTNESVATMDVERTLNGTIASDDWNLGAWSETTGWPASTTFHQQRLCFAYTKTQPQTIWLSQTGDFENFQPDSDVDGVFKIEDDDALDYTLSADEVNAIRWMSAGRRELMIGTTGGEWTLVSDGAVVTPVDATVTRQTKHGGAQINPVRTGPAVLFVQRDGRRVREMAFDYQVDGYRAPDMTRLAYHVTKSGVKEMAFAPEPDPALYCVRNDGVIAVMTYGPDENVTSWGRWITGDNGVVESIATIPGNSANNSAERTEIWLVVRRTINGQAKRYIEMLQANFDGPLRNDYDSEAEFKAAVLAAQKDAFYVDCGLTYSGAATATITGLSHIEGKTVSVLADGATHPQVTVTGGAITLQRAASKVHVGLPYRHRLKMLRIEAGGQAGTAVGKTKRIHGVTAIVMDTGIIRIGPSTDRMDEFDFREVADAMDQPAPLFTGERFVPFDGDFDLDPRVVIEGDAPLPFVMLALAIELKTNDIR